MGVENLDNFKYPFWAPKTDPFSILQEWSSSVRVVTVVHQVAAHEGPASKKVIRKCFDQHASTRVRTHGTLKPQEKTLFWGAKFGPQNGGPEYIPSYDGVMFLGQRAFQKLLL